MNDQQVSPSQRVQDLCRLLGKERYQCSMNCYRCIRRKDTIWTCGTCFHIFHMQCIKLWAKKSGDNSSFCCPQCRQSQRAPTDYTCFCGQVQNPVSDPGLTPHSCGKTCGKKHGSCPHPCPLQCHPGPCPPCSFRKGPVNCPCGSSSYTYPCGEDDPQRTCEKTCGKILNCGKHKCSKVCHSGECDICLIEAQVSCNCGKKTETFLCGASFACNQPCGKKLPCARHYCQEICHSGDCPPCPMSPAVVKTCHCGSSLIQDQRKTCADPIPSCSSPCNKWLSCGRHKCRERCHPGECPPCGQLCDATCLCGKSGKKQLPCSKVDLFRCDRVCCTQLSCQRHKCMKKCCPDNGNKEAQSHICLALCDKIHPCGHPCPLPCHKGRCPPCLATIPTFLTCRCGKTLSDPPPLPCGSVPPVCKEPCQLVRECGHPSSDHTCHFDDCPSCTFPVKRMCAGKHTEVEAPCGLSIVQCDLSCGKKLDCEHFCPRICHAGPCAEVGKPCKLQCGKEREYCFHTCKRPCHFGSSCPECTQKVRVTCPCGRNTFFEKCSVAKRKYSKIEKIDEESFVGVLECNDNCLFHSRLEALSARKKSVEEDQFIFLVSLYELGVDDPTYVTQIESKLRSFIQDNTGYEVMALPPASRNRRELVHLLARYYRIDVTSEDSGKQRSCVLRKTPYSTSPRVCLSQQLSKGLGNPRRFISTCIEKNLKQNQILTNSRHTTVVNALVTLLGSFTFTKPENDECYYCLYFVSRGKREDACSLLRQQNISFIRGEISMNVPPKLP